MKKRRTYSGDFKAKVVGDFLNGKMSLQELADLYQIHPNLIKNWRTLLIKRAHLVLDDRRRTLNRSPRLFLSVLPNDRNNRSPE